VIIDDEQETDALPIRTIMLVGAAVVVATLALVCVAWLFVTPPPASLRLPVVGSVLEHGLYEQATAGEDANAAGAQRLAGYRWVDRDRHLAHIPIERAIDAVAADPSLLAPRPAR
jgi:hypothetical protein